MGRRRDGLRAMMAVVDVKLRSVLGSLSKSVVCVGKRSGWEVDVVERSSGPDAKCELKVYCEVGDTATDRPTDWQQGRRVYGAGVCQAINLEPSLLW